MVSSDLNTINYVFSISILTGTHFFVDENTNFPFDTIMLSRPPKHSQEYVISIRRWLLDGNISISTNESISKVLDKIGNSNKFPQTRVILNFSTDNLIIQSLSLRVFNKNNNWILLHYDV